MKSTYCSLIRIGGSFVSRANFGINSKLEILVELQENTCGRSALLPLDEVDDGNDDGNND